MEAREKQTMQAIETLKEFGLKAEAEKLENSLTTGRIELQMYNESDSLIYDAMKNAGIKGHLYLTKKGYMFRTK